ncbi:hypothetical protein [Syntrophomonas palmitatica]|nr:hypothetical protein [Syntrophomonas palmitatica]
MDTAQIQQVVLALSLETELVQVNAVINRSQVIQIGTAVRIAYGT